MDSEHLPPRLREVTRPARSVMAAVCALLGSAVLAAPASAASAPASAERAHLVGLSPPAARPSSPSPRAPRPAGATATPGMQPGPSCATQVSYQVNGHTATPVPLPAPVSQVGGATLAQPGLHVTSATRTPPPGPKATSWLVADLNSGEVLAACNAHVPLAPASTLKVLTGLALMPLIDPARKYQARQEDAQVDGTRVGLVPGSVYSVDDLWHGLLMSSANDTATALAAMAGGTATATAAMQDKARALGAADTRPLNTSGLDLPGQVSSAYDLALFGRAALAEPKLVRLMQTRNYAFPEAGTASPGPARKTFQIQNHNKLLYNYPGALGVKNGWTSTTGGSFVAAASRGGRRYIATVMAADPETWHMEAALLDWAFSTPAGPDPGVGRLVDGPDPTGALGPTGGGSAQAGGAVNASGSAAAQDPPRAAVSSTDNSGLGRLLPIAAIGGLVVLAAAGTTANVLHRRRRRRTPADEWSVPALTPLPGPPLPGPPLPGPPPDDELWRRRGR